MSKAAHPDDLELQQARLAAIIDSSEDAIVSKDLNGIVTSWNAAAERVYGWKAEEIVGRSKALVIPPDLPHELDSILERIRAGKRVERYETRRLRKDGTMVEVEISISPIKDRTGQIVGAATIVRDITERKRLEMHRARLAAIVDSSDDAILSKTLEGVITSWNVGAQRIFGYTAQEAVGRPMLLLFPPERIGEELDILARIRRGERIEHFESVRVRKDGQLLDVSLTISPIQNSKGAIIGASTIARDITDSKRAQRELAELNERLRGAMRETHHRVKNNLQVIAAILDMVRADYPDAVPTREIQRICQQVVTLAGIHDILTREAQSLNEADTLLSAQDVLHRLLNLLEGTAHRYHVEHNVEDIRLTLRQVTALALAVNELVLNAVKHGGGNIQVRLQKDGQGARLVVEDDGPGLPPGFSLPTTANTGLMLVSTLAEGDLGGALHFENRAEGGARVSVTIPMPS